MLLGLFLFGFIGIFFRKIFFERKVVKARNDGNSKVMAADKIIDLSVVLGEKNTLQDVSQFFDIILPLEFTYRPWYNKFWIRMLEKHPYIAYLAPAEGRENYTAKKWMCMTFELLNVLFIDSIFASIASPDPEVCGKYATPSSCTEPSSIDLIDPLCEWDEEYNICVFREIGDNMGVIIISVLIIKLVEFPLMTLCEYLINQAGSVPATSRAIKVEEYVDSQEKSFVGIESIHLHQKLENDVILTSDVGSCCTQESVTEARRTLYRLAARLSYLQTNLDTSTVEDEVDHLLTHADFQFKSDVFENLSFIPLRRSTSNELQRRKLVAFVQRARNMSHTVLKELEEKTNQKEKEIYLVKRFIVELLSGVNRWVAERFFFDEVESEISLPYRVFCAVILMLIICGELTYVFLMGVMLGAEATRVWFICLAVVVMQGKR